MSVRGIVVAVFDHVTIRASDRAASERLYESIAPYAAFRLSDDTPERAQFHNR